MRVLVCGDRNWTDTEAIKRELKNYSKDTVIVHGACRGADRIAGEIGKELGLTIEEFPADWRKHGKAAGHIRNKQMIDEGKPNLVLAFHSDIESSKVTKNMLRQSEKAGIETKLFEK